MKEPKRIITLTSMEHRLLMSFLFQYRNMLLSEGHHPDVCDKLLVKLQRRRRRRFL